MQLPFLTLNVSVPGTVECPSHFESWRTFVSFLLNVELLHQEERMSIGASAI